MLVSFTRENKEDEQFLIIPYAKNIDKAEFTLKSKTYVSFPLFDDDTPQGFNDGMFLAVVMFKRKIPERYLIEKPVPLISVLNFRLLIG